MPEFRNARDLVSSIKRTIKNQKDDIMLALSAEISRKLSKETGGEVEVIPIVTEDKVIISYLETDPKKAKAHRKAFKKVRNDIAENVESILRKRNII